MVDRATGFPFVEELSSTVTGQVTKQLERWFNDFGWPSYVRTDGGAQFRTEFFQFCALHNIIQELAAPYHSESNGLAEAGVKNVKSLLSKCLEMGQDFRPALLAWRNTPRQDGYSPAQLMFGQRQRTSLPTLEDIHHAEVDREAGMLAHNEAAAYKRQVASKGTRTLSPLSVGQKVRLQDPLSHRWDKKAVIVRIREGGHSFEVLADNNKLYVRNRKFIRPLDSETSTTDKEEKKEVTTTTNCSNKDVATTAISAPPLRRSKRTPKPSVRYDPSS
jgi:hypothetical protein